VRSNARIDLYLLGGIIVFAGVMGLLAVCFAEESQTEKANENDKCHVCHPDLKTEEISTDHLDMDITCDECHGPSVEHMHDEMLMTKPDILFGRSEVERMCSDPTCHKPGDGREVYGREDHKDPVAVEAFFDEWRGRIRPNGRAVGRNSVCTDCHGTHNITKATTQAGDEQAAEWVAAFNGRDLTGWKSSGDSLWTVKAGRIVAAGASSDEGNTLWTEAAYENYLLAVTFRATWPVRAGIWLRGEGSRNGPRVEIFESKQPIAFTGSLRVPGKGLALVNLREDLIDRESWNTVSVKVEGDRIQLWVNGEEIGVVRAAGPQKGRIGLYVGKQAESKSAELCVREVLIQRLSEPQEQASQSSEN
jgi:hypothetical protein